MTILTVSCQRYRNIPICAGKMSIKKVFKTDYVGFVIKYACILIGTDDQLRYYGYTAGNEAEPLFVPAQSRYS